jgi:hypothetical protein
MFRAIVSNHYKIRTLPRVGPVAQRLEQRTHNPLVLGSNPSGPTNQFLSRAFAISSFSCFAHFAVSVRYEVAGDSYEPIE